MDLKIYLELIEKCLYTSLIWETLPISCWQCIEVIFRDRHRSCLSSESVFDSSMVFLLAYQDADSRLITRISESIIYETEIKSELASVFGNKLPCLELYHDIALESRMIEQEIEIVILSVESDMILIADIGKSDPKLKDKIFEIFDELGFEFSFLVFISETEKIKNIAIFYRIGNHLSLMLFCCDVEVMSLVI